MKKRLLTMAAVLMAILTLSTLPLNYALAENNNATSDALATELTAGNLFLFPDDQSVIGDEESAASAAEDADVKSAKVRVDGLNVRVEPNKNSESLFQLHSSESVAILEDNVEGWTKISYGIIEGYAVTSSLFFVTEKGYNGTVWKDKVSVKEAAEADAKEVTTLAAGNGIQVLDFENGYYKVTYDGKTGYALPEHITLDGTFTAEAATRYLKAGMEGAAVTKMQKELKRRNFMTASATGLYGDASVAAIKAFQKAAKISQTGHADAATLKLLYGNNNIKKKVTTSSSSSSSSSGSSSSNKVTPTQVKGKVILADWKVVNGIIPRGSTSLTIVDVRTGITFRAKRKGGTLHMDTEPLTAADTANLKKAYGGKFSWARRPVWVVYNGKYYAASMNGMPHADWTITNNNFNGHICVHFLNSQTHAEPGVSQKVDSAHQACIREAFNAAK
ncbi:MAG: hypothetical protein E7328_01430 [Clostridiales bacterium]|nr:hypothetical protein [Clostridiales bacterium]